MKKILISIIFLGVFLTPILAEVDEDTAKVEVKDAETEYNALLNNKSLAKYLPYAKTDFAKENLVKAKYFLDDGEYEEASYYAVLSYTASLTSKKLAEIFRAEDKIKDLKIKTLQKKYDLDASSGKAAIARKVKAAVKQKSIDFKKTLKIKDAQIAKLKKEKKSILKNAAGASAKRIKELEAEVQKYKALSDNSAAETKISLLEAGLHPAGKFYKGSYTQLEIYRVKRRRGSRIYYGKTLNDDMKKKLDILYSVLQKQKQAKLFINGYSYCRNSRSRYWRNKAERASKAYAKIIRDYLVQEKGLDSGRIEMAGKGDISTDQQPTDRVEIIVQKLK